MANLKLVIVLNHFLRFFDQDSVVTAMALKKLKTKPAVATLCSVCDTQNSCQRKTMSKMYIPLLKRDIAEVNLEINLNLKKILGNNIDLIKY